MEDDTVADLAQELAVCYAGIGARAPTARSHASALCLTLGQASRLRPTAPLRARPHRNGAHYASLSRTPLLRSRGSAWQACGVHRQPHVGVRAQRDGPADRAQHPAVRAHAPPHMLPACLMLPPRDRYLAAGNLRDANRFFECFHDVPRPADSLPSSAPPVARVSTPQPVRDTPLLHFVSFLLLALEVRVWPAGGAVAERQRGRALTPSRCAARRPAVGAHAAAVLLALPAARP